MNRHSLIFRLGHGDIADIPTQENAITTEVQLADLTGALNHGIGDTLEQLQRLDITPSEAGIDLLILASAVYAADKRINRASEAQDCWTREIDLHLPVSNVEVWTNNAQVIREMLRFLTGDLWRVYFRPRIREFREIAVPTGQLPGFGFTEVSLFSGGLDSFIGAIDSYEADRLPLLVSHGWLPNDSKHQQLCLDAYRNTYGQERVFQIRSRVGFEEGLIAGNEPERTERARSFLFFSLAAISASGMAGHATISVPENALISLNIPLDVLRLGSFSTRTTHPYFLFKFNQLLSCIAIDAELNNPYRFKTKGEMVAECANPEFLQNRVADTTSCSSANKGRWKGEPPGHCGHCVPCIIRRAALLSLPYGDPTHYTLAGLHQRHLRSDRAEGEDMRSFQIAIARLNHSVNRARVLIHQSGPLPVSKDDLEAYAQVYLRGMQEVEQFLNGVQIHP